MRVKRVLRYYCDHCNRGVCSKSAMTLHEGRCIKNPERTCGFCRTAEIPQVPIAGLITALESGDVDVLRVVANGCPACMLSAIVQQRETSRDCDGWVSSQMFDYKTEVTKFWDKRNADFAVPAY